MKKTDKEIIDAIKKCLSRSDICRKFGWCIGGCSFKKINLIINKYNIDTSHFITNKSYLLIKYPKIQKICPICNKLFETKKGHPKEG